MSEMFALSARAVDRIAAADPGLAILLGIPGPGPGLSDYSPEGHQRRADLTADLLAEALATPAPTSADRIARDVMVQQFEHSLAAHAAGDHLRDLNVLSSPPQLMRMTLEFAPPQATAELVAQVPETLAGWRAALALGADRGLVAARRQSLAVATQLNTYAEQWLPAFAQQRGVEVSAAVAALRDTSLWLSDLYTTRAADSDAVGEERYLRCAAAYNGMTLDLDDTFAWGWDEVDRLTRELRAEAARLDPTPELRDLRRHLDEDPSYRIEGVPALVEHLRGLTDSAIARVDGILFDIDPRVRACGVEIAAEGSAAAPYYVPPSEDLSRPGSTWYPVRGADTFPRWWLTTVWFHEGVPGHHLQLGATAVQQDMSRFQRVLGSTSGHAEGWALYAERLCDESGWFDEPGTRIGYLSAQLMRAVRVVVDIGLHTGRRVPTGFPGERGAVTPALARTMLTDVALVEPDFASSEVDRYLGMPGQAISYKVGERVWLEQRDRARSRAGTRFDLKDWHMAAMRLGPMGLDQFATEMGRPAET